MALLSSPNTLINRDLRRALKYSVIQTLPLSTKLNAIPRMLPDYKCIYIHVPKTGGTSIANVLNDLKPSRSKSQKLRLHEHVKAHEVKRLIGEENWSQYFSFAFVRNPWDLMVSCYHWWLQKADSIYFKQDIELIRQLGTFTEFMYSRYGQLLINECEGNLFDWISEEDKLIVDFVGRFESLQADFNQVCNHLDIEPIELPHTNQTSRRDYRDYYNDATRLMVAKRFQKTIEYFGYHF